ncbi:hypothetical protein [Streptosporangium sp. KLBMP 9127]|nr:hypothetical protein [Streptosporangium sp. KLBMP 9127]
MVNSLIVPILVTTDLPPDSDLRELGQLLADAVRDLEHDTSGVHYPGHLRGATFWLDRPAPPPEPGSPAQAPEQLRFAAMLGFLSVAGPRESAREVIVDAREAVTAAVIARYGDLGSTPAVMSIRADDVRERTPDDAVVTTTARAETSPAETGLAATVAGLDRPSTTPAAAVRPRTGQKTARVSSRT